MLSVTILMNLNKTLQIRIDPKVAAKLEKIANKEGQTVSAYVRRLLYIESQKDGIRKAQGEK